jgi:hypothetical protein
MKVPYIDSFLPAHERLRKAAVPSRDGEADHKRDLSVLEQPSSDRDLLASLPSARQFGPLNFI